MITAEPRETAYVQLDAIGKAFEHAGSRRQVLEDIDLEIAREEFVAIVGPSGCGKSSLLRIIDGLIRPDTGTVRISGTAVTGPRADVGLVFQQFNLLPWKTVLQNVLFGLESMGLSKKEREDRARDWLSIVGLEGFESYHPRQLSGGMQQRVSLARTMARDPALVLMDEPFGALDALTRTYLQQEVVRLWQYGDRTGVLVTHDIEEALLLADRVIVMASAPGKISSTIDVPFAHPRDERTRRSPEFIALKDQIWHLSVESMAQQSSFVRMRENDSA